MGARDLKRLVSVNPGGNAKLSWKLPFQHYASTFPVNLFFPVRGFWSCSRWYFPRKEEVYEGIPVLILKAVQKESLGGHRLDNNESKKKKRQGRKPPQYWRLSGCKIWSSPISRDARGCKHISRGVISVYERQDLISPISLQWTKPYVLWIPKICANQCPIKQSRTWEHSVKAVSLQMEDFGIHLARGKKRSMTLKFPGHSTPSQCFGIVKTEMVPREYISVFKFSAIHLDRIWGVHSELEWILR